MFVQGQKLLFDHLMQVPEVRSADRPAHGNEHIQSSFDHHSFIDGHEDLAVGLGLIGENPGRERGDAVEPMGQKSERAFARFRDNA